MRNLVLAGFLLLVVQTAAQTHITAYDRGPDGLEAWTDDHHTKQFRKNTEPFGIVIARHGKVIRHIGHKDGGPFSWDFGKDGGPFFWNVKLLPDGKRVAFQSGDFHMAEMCTLMDIRSGKHLEDRSCFSEAEIDNGPQWVKDLLDSDHAPPPGFRPPFGSESSRR